jgi:stage V sporulation protein G
METKIQVTRICRLDNSKTKAFVDILINEVLLIKGLKILNGRNGLFITMPQYKAHNGRFYDVVFPLTKEIREYISSVILDTFNED